MDTKSPFSPNQIGYKKGYITADRLFVLNTIVNKIVKVQKQRLYAAFTNF